MDKTTAKELDSLLATMTDEQRQELTREGGRLMRGDQATYMRHYRARRALAVRMGLTVDTKDTTAATR